MLLAEEWGPVASHTWGSAQLGSAGSWVQGQLHQERGEVLGIERDSLFAARILWCPGLRGFDLGLRLFFSVFSALSAIS